MVPAFRIWRASYICRQGSPNSVHIQGEKSTFAPQLDWSYEIELYVVTGDLPGLDAGVYHFNPADVSLRLLRKGDLCEHLAQATATEPVVVEATGRSSAPRLTWESTSPSTISASSAEPQNPRRPEAWP